MVRYEDYIFGKIKVLLLDQELGMVRYLELRRKSQRGEITITLLIHKVQLRRDHSTGNLRAELNTHIHGQQFNAL